MQSFIVTVPVAATKLSDLVPDERCRSILLQAINGTIMYGGADTAFTLAALNTVQLNVQSTRNIYVSSATKSLAVGLV